ncbi:MAG TPA: hypothetical protein VGF84_16755 [Micromonosporaceae bacterium]|jgi:hypothetical protein
MDQAHDYSMSRIGHRNRLRYLEIVDAVVYVDLIAELVTRRRLSAPGSVLFVRDQRGVRLDDPDCVPDGMSRAPSGLPEINHDVGSRLRGSAIVLLLHNRETGATHRIATEAGIEATPEIGPPRRRCFTVQFSATVAFDLAETVRSDAPIGAWDVFTELRTLGTATTAPVGPFRDKAQVDHIAAESELPDRRRVRATLTGFGPQLALQLLEPRD